MVTRKLEVAADNWIERVSGAGRIIEKNAIKELGYAKKTS
jgi:hypothetical protein